MSLNLPAAIEDLSGDKVPKSVLEKAQAVRERGGVNTIDTLMQDLPELLQRNREILDEVSRCNGDRTVTKFDMHCLKPHHYHNFS